MQPLALPGGKSQPRFLHIANLIRVSYVFLALFLALAVFFAIQFRNASRWRMSPAYIALDERDRQLADMRKFLTQGMTATRDHLINNHPNSEELYEQEVRRAKANVTKAFLNMAPWAAQRTLLTQVDHDLAEFWSMLDENRFVSAKMKSEQGYDFLHSQLLPLRNDLFGNLKLLGDRLAEERAVVGRTLARERSLDLTYVFLCMGAAMAISLLMASGNQKYRRDYQIESRAKFEEMARARDSLEQLSGRLLRIQEDERRKISRELHDGIGQLLTALRMEIHQVQFGASGTLNGTERLLSARKLAEEAVQTVNNISLLLRPPLLDDLGLEPALGWLADQFGRRTGIRCRFSASHLQEHLPDDIKTCIFRVIQEALNNCEKHASPTQVEIAVEQTEGAITVCVEDDGAGFALNENNTPARHAGLGILGMRERAVLLGGTLTIRSAPGKGTKLMINLPLATVGTPVPLREFALPGRTVIT